VLLGKGDKIRRRQEDALTPTLSQRERGEEVLSFWERIEVREKNGDSLGRSQWIPKTSATP